MKSIVLAAIAVALFFYSSTAQQIPPAGGGGFQPHELAGDDLSPEFRESIKAELRTSLRTLRNELKSGTFFPVVEPGAFQFPLSASDTFPDYGFHAISGFVDHDPEYPGKLLDWNGGQRTYDTDDGYNHQGTDFVLWPFGWHKMHEEQVYAVAADSGVIAGKVDGQYDMNCGWVDESWNAVYVLHNNGVLAWYGHLKKGTVTQKFIGDTLVPGEYLGVIGSSGSSTAPHLHFEIYDSEMNLLDPYAGPFNPSITQSIWANQPDYYSPGLNALMTHDQPPVYPDCPQTELLHQKTVFEPGSTIYFSAHYRDQREGDHSRHTILDPQNRIWQSWDHVMPDPYYAASYWYWYRTIPESEPAGEWKFQVTYKGQTYETPFIIDDQTDVETEQSSPCTWALEQNYPNPFNPATTIGYSLQDEAVVTLDIFTIEGQRVSRIRQGSQPAGRYEAAFDAGYLPSGLYVYRISAVGVDGVVFTDSKKMLLVK